MIEILIFCIWIFLVIRTLNLQYEDLRDKIAMAAWAVPAFILLSIARYFRKKSESDVYIIEYVVDTVHNGQVPSR